MASAFFTFSDDSKVETIEIELTNDTGEIKNSPYKYSHLALDEFMQRMKDFPLVAVDHTGFNLPWFSGIHPRIKMLRNILPAVSLYHHFPKKLAVAPWDFIMPGTLEEINNDKIVDYSIHRKPKIEIVSFENSSTPLIQIEIQVIGKYDDFVRLFPEGIAVPDAKSVWVYIKNDMGIDICFVLNEVEERDWVHHFADSRLY